MADDWGDRPRPPWNGGERETLDGWLDFHRATLLWKCEGLSLDQLKTRSVPTSALTLLGLVRHMTEVERGWFLAFLGEEHEWLYSTTENIDADFDVERSGSLLDVERFGVEVDAIKDKVEAHGLDETFEVDGHARSLRWVYTHMIEEYARHNGHADLIREAIDGSVGD